jgi:RHS repeat-associated protein
MTVQRETLLCRYRYDPLDRIANCAPLNHCSVQRFYRKNRLATEIQGQVQYSVFEHESQLMAQQKREGGRVDSALLGTDLQCSVLHSVAVGQHQQPVYSPYGHRSPESGLGSLLGFNGERRDPVTGHYLLGNGYRAFNPVLMRFNSPDSLSPFGKGGVNAYAYCLGDPVNRVDPMGDFALLARGITQLVSVPLSALQKAGKGFRAMKKSVMSSFSKAAKPKSPPRPSPLNALIDESTDLVELRKIGDEFKMARDAYQPPTIARFAETQGYSEQALFAQDGYKNFPKVQEQYLESRPYLDPLRQADVNLLVATGRHVKRYPHSERATRQMIQDIRSS